MAVDGHIRLLPTQVANKIAAGEVVERPAAVVKELVENAIDAGATRIEITVTAGGRRLISVSDNGCGMGRDDALLSIERQATSKLRDVDDIERIATLGFRGEALPSIASVSRFTLKSRKERDEAGTELVVNGGSLQEVSATGMAPGTVIEVRDLFYNVPARRKFLRAYQTEQGHIRAVFTLQALAHPAVGLTLVADGYEAYRLLPGATLEERVRDLFGEEFRAGLRKVDRRNNNIHVHGFAGLPNTPGGAQGEQYIFVNHRPASAPVVSYALRAAYPPMERERRPVVLLFITLPPEQVDVNVHPAKREVRFRNGGEVRDAIIAAVSEAIGYRHPHSTPGISGPPQGRDAPISPLRAPRSNAGDISLRTLVPGASATGAPSSAPRTAVSLPYPGTSGTAIEPVAGPITALPPPESGLSIRTEGDTDTPWRWCRFLGQIDGRYLLVETDDGYVTIDPRAAQERVLYEQLMECCQQGENHCQKLLLPESVQLAPAAAARLRRFLPCIKAMGFAVDELEGDFFIVEELPAILGDISCRALLESIAHDIEKSGAKRGAERWREEIVAKAACRAAAGAITRMEEKQAAQLVNDLARARMPYTCPRGRPTMILTSYRELSRKFRR